MGQDTQPLIQNIQTDDNDDVYQYEQEETRFDSKDQDEEEDTRTVWHWIRDFSIVTVMIGSWLIYAELQNELATHHNWKHSYWLIFLANVLNVIAFPAFELVRKAAQWLNHNDAAPAKPQASIQEEVLGLFTSWKTFLVFSGCSTLMWFVNIYFYFLSLTLTSAASGIAIFNSSAVFTYIFSVIFLRETLTVIKTVSVVGGLAGVVLISLGDDSSKTGSHEWLGDVMAGLASLIFSIYMVHYSYYFRNSSLRLIAFYVTLIGVWTALFAWPLLIIANYTGIEEFAFQPTDSIALTFWWVVVVLDFVSSSVTFLAVPITSPLFIAIVNLLAIPLGLILGYLIDKIWDQHGTSFTALNITGSCMIFVAFIGIELHFRNPLIKKYNDICRFTYWDKKE